MTVVETQDVVCREAAFCAKGAGESTSLLGPAGRSMRLKISRDAMGASNIVELASRRCLVGSAPSCDVRVDEPGVAPIECLIFHGAKNNVVRWLETSREFAGGEFFEDEVLRAGDPLQIGPVELELLVDEIMAAEEPSETEELPETSEDRLAEYILRLERLEIQLIQLQASEVTASLSDAIVPDISDTNHEVAATIRDLATQLAFLQSRSAADRELWSGEKADLEALLQSRLREFDFLQDEVQSLRDELGTVRSEYSNLFTSHDASQHLAEVSQELAERTEDFERERTNWDRDRSEFQRQLQQNMERFEQFETQLAEQSKRQAESEAARQAAKTRADRLQESVEKLSTRLAEQQQDYESARAAWDADRTSLESELAETMQRFAQSAADESTGLELREAWDRERTALQGQVDEAILRVEEVQNELEAQRRQLGEQHQSGCDSQLDDRTFDQPIEAAEQWPDQEIIAGAYNAMDRLLAESSSVNDRGNEADDLVRDFTSPTPMIRDGAESEFPDVTCPDGGDGLSAHEASDYCEQAFSGLQLAADFNDATADEDTFEEPLLAVAEANDYDHAFEATESASDEGEEVAFEMPASTPPVSTADVLARWGQSGVWSDDETDADDSSDVRITDASNSPNDGFSRFAEPETAEPQYGQPQYTPVNETPFASSGANATSDSDDREESIEDYMARLMNRVRATDDLDEPSRRVRPTIERSPVTEYTEVTKAPRPDREPEPEKFNPDEYKPRSQAPEAADRMTAMRSLANDSARTAIASHTKRNWSSEMKLKLLVSVFAFVSVLASIIFFWGDTLLMVVGSLAGVGVLAYWTRNAITYRKLLLDSLMLEPEGGEYDDSPEGEEAAYIRRSTSAFPG